MILNLTPYTVRLWIIPILMGFVWIASFLVSFFYDYNGMPQWSQIFIRLVSAFNIILFFELLLMYWDIKLSLKYFDLKSDHAFSAQCRTIPFMVFALSLACLTLRFPEWLWLFVLILFCAKVSMHHVVVYIDNNKRPIEYGSPQTI